MDIATLIDLQFIPDIEDVKMIYKIQLELLDELKLYPQCYEEKIVDCSYDRKTKIFKPEDEIDIILCVYVPHGSIDDGKLYIENKYNFTTCYPTFAKVDEELLLEESNNLIYGNSTIITKIEDENYYQIQTFPYMTNNVGEMFLYTFSDSGLGDITGIKVYGIEIFDDELRELLY